MGKPTKSARDQIIIAPTVCVFIGIYIEVHFMYRPWAYWQFLNDFCVERGFCLVPRENQRGLSLERESETRSISCPSEIFASCWSAGEFFLSRAHSNDSVTAIPTHVLDWCSGGFTTSFRPPMWGRTLRKQAERSGGRDSDVRAGVAAVAKRGRGGASAWQDVADFHTGRVSACAP